MSTTHPHSHATAVTSTADSDTAVSTQDGITAALPPGFTLQDIAVRLAGGVCEAYSAYNNGKNLQPALSGYHDFNSIYVWEIDPNVNPFGTAEVQVEARVAARARAGSAEATNAAQRLPAAYTTRAGAVPNPCTGPKPVGKPSAGSQLFGFTATADDHSHNLLVFRGTVTMQEAGYDLLGWGNNTGCLLPSQWYDQTNYGPVNSYLYDFYVNNDLGAVTSLALSTINAIQATMGHDPNIPWFIGGHSLGGAITSLAALDAVTSGAFGSNNLPFVFTFGSLHVGDGTFAANYKTQVPLSARFANLCDFVPSMVSLEPIIPADPYVHVGEEATFVWQTWDDWGNHSHANIYQPMVQSNWDVIQWGARHYPQ
jgi:hypothetical protein